MGRFWVVLGLLGGSFGGLGGSWAALGRLLGVWRLSWIDLGRVLGGSWEALGGLEAVLDRSWAALSRHGLLRVMLEPTRCGDGVALEGPRGANL